MRQTVFKQMENENDAAATIREAAQAMGKGETGYKPFSMDNTDYYIFYKPFIRAAVPGRAMENLNWSAGIIYPENDIFGDYNRLIYYVFAIAVVGLLLLFVCSRSLIHHQLLPLRMLTASTQRIARGNYNEEIPYSPQKDEIGQLQNHFQQMQESLATNVGELEQLTTTLHEHEVELKAAYDRMRQADRMKTVFLHNMTNQMIRPTTVIMNNVQTLCDIGYHVNVGERLVGDILQQGETVAELLDNLLRVAENETNKEGGL
jgi:methyl-accepting chemotaxis protein/sigma-B regulation protein RsbU (phosphoserine phosphatase)